MACKCQDPCAPDPIVYTLTLNSTTGDLTILPTGTVVNLVDSIHNFETITSFSNLRLVGNVLEVTYIPENGATEVRTVDLSTVIGGNPPALTVSDTNSIDLNLDLSNNLTANLLIDPASTTTITSSSVGVRIDCCPETSLTVVDTNTIDFGVSGTNNHTLTGSVRFTDSNTVTLSSGGSGLYANVKISNDPDNIITSDANGLFATGGAETPITLNDSNSIDLVGSGFNNHTITANLKIDGTGTAPVSITSSGLKVDCCAQTPITVTDSNTIDFSISGSNSHTLTGVVKYIDSNSIDFSDSSSGLTGIVKYSLDGGNLAHAGTDGGIFVGSVLPTPPTVNAGPDQNIISPTSSVTMAASGSTTTGTMSGYIWTKISGPSSYSITNSGSLTTTITSLVVGTYVFRLLGISSIGLSSIDDITITVTASALDTIYYGTNVSGITPNSSQLTSGSHIFGDGSLDVSINYGATSPTPVFYYVAIPNTGTPYVKNHWFESTLNQGSMLGPTDLFNTPTIVNVSGTDYNVWITNYATQFTANNYVYSKV